jgi:hypothetical protein
LVAWLSPDRRKIVRRLLSASFNRLAMSAPVKPVAGDGVEIKAICPLNLANLNLEVPRIGCRQR